MEIHTYPEMNQKIKDILRLGDDPMCLYAAARIEELETLLAAAVKDIWNFSTGNTCRSCIHWVAGRCSRPGSKDCAGYRWWKWRGFADAADDSSQPDTAAQIAMRYLEELAKVSATRFDRIRACITPVDMALELNKNERRFCPMEYSHKHPDCNDSCGECITNWLNEESET